METKKMKASDRRILVTLAVYLATILLALILGVTHQIAGWVAQVAVALSLFRLVFLLGWGEARRGKHWRV
ncbi:MAG: hypothetical protein J6K03_01380 [Oscillospiraceae bacterium]|nr:hypothetical protein [Oscillospiraceae bacterium]